jgi:hypothetical protein
MIKQIYLIRGIRNESYRDFNKRIRHEAAHWIKQDKIIKLSMTITEASPPKISVIPFKNLKLVSITVFKNGDEPIEEIVKSPGFEGAYAVTDAYPISYDKTWENGEKSPGVCLLTLFKQKRSIDYQTFINRWHNSHTPLSLKIHPLWHYNRNVVDEKLSATTATWDGIVEEHMRTESDLLNPFKFFGNPLTILPNMIRVFLDTYSFLDYGSIEPYLVTEYHLKG